MGRGFRVYFPFEFYRGYNIAGTSIVNYITDLAEGTEGEVYWYFTKPISDSDDQWIYPKKWLSGGLKNVGFVNIYPYARGKNRSPLKSVETSILQTFGVNEQELKQIVKMQRDGCYVDFVAGDLMANVLIYKKIWKYKTLTPSRVQAIRFMGDPFWPGKEGMDDEALMNSEILVALSVDAMLWGNTDEKHRWINSHGSRLSYPAVREIEEKSYEFGRVVDFDLIDSYKDIALERRARRREGGDVLRLGFFGDLGNSRAQFGKIFETVKKIRAIRDVEFLVSSMLSYKYEYPSYVKFHSGVRLREDYLSLLGDADILPVAHTYHGLVGGVGFVEQTVCGLVPVFLWHPWMADFIPPWYKLVARGWDEFVSMLVWCLDNIDKAEKHRARLEEWFRQEYDKSIQGSRLVRILDEVYRDGRMRGSMYELTLKAAEKMPDEFSILELSDAARSVSRRGGALLKNRFIDAKYVADILRYNGYRDTCETFIPRFRRCSDG